MGRVIIVVLVILLLGAGAILAGLSFFLLSSRTALDTPNPLAIQIAESGKSFLIPPDAAAQTNPVATSPDALASAARNYGRCTLCHGPDGKGNTQIGSHIYPRAADLTAPRTQNKSDGALHWIIANGIVHTGMPGWGTTFSDNDIWGLVTYVRQLPKGVPQVPTPTPAANSAANVTVNISNYTYLPTEMTVPVGTTVTWTNHDDDAHTITAAGDSKLFDSGEIGKDETFQFTFTSAGTYNYLCTVHDNMSGVVVVK
jgi:plastocyanin